MSLPNSVNNHLKFLTAEVCSQLSNLQLLISRRSSILSQQVIERSGHTYNLKLRVHAECLQVLRSEQNKDLDIVTLRAVEDIATKLENIASLCQDCTRQINQLESRQVLKKLSYKKWLHKIELALQQIDELLKTTDTDKALKIGGLQDKVGRFYRSTSDELIKSLKKHKSAEDIVTALFIARHIHEMSQAVLEITEAIISVNVGQAMPIERYRALRALIEGLELNDDWRSLNVRSLADTRSGSAISGVIDPTQKNTKKPYLAVFKDGQTNKVLEEHQGVTKWHKLYPGIAPKILSQHTEGATSALMIEHLPGDTFEKIILNGSDKAMYKALKYFTRTLESIWDATKQKENIPPKHCQQLSKRLPTVYGLHPEFESLKFEGETISSLLEQAKKIEQKLVSPFTVYIHGDLNVDNIIYDRQQRHVYFIDLHRSRHMDYVQDIAVFMVSNYRLPITDELTRLRTHHIIERFYQFVSDYAERNNDKTFQLRLALGLARSFASSTRFTLDTPLANSMFITALHLLNLVIKTPLKKQLEFTLTIKDIMNASS